MYLLFDIGGTNTRIATSLDGKTLTPTQTIPTEKDFEQQIQMIAEVTGKLKEGNKIEAAAGGIAGIYNEDKSALIKSPHLPEWAQRPLKEELETVFVAPVYLENDSHLGGLGEACFGAGQDFKIMAYIAIGTGIGGVRIVDKQIDKNVSGFEPGHQTIKFDGPKCNCGGLGHLETFIAGAYLEKMYGAKGESIKDESVWEEIAKFLAIGLNNTIVHWSPNVVVVGGSVIEKIPLPQVKSYLNQYLTIFPSPEVIKGTLGQEAALYGALKLINNI